MKKEVGSKNSRIWLLGDSNPKAWQAKLSTPLDPRHPARHNIWTPVLDQIQDRVFRACGRRVDASHLFIRNAIEEPSSKPLATIIEWESRILSQVQELQEMVAKYQPTLLLSFGAFSFEFARRALAEETKYAYQQWRTATLGEQFRERIDRFTPRTTTLLPLLHVSVARGRFIQSHDYFCDREGANYFEFVGESIATKLIDHAAELDIWINR